MSSSWLSYDDVGDRYASAAEPVYFAGPAEDLISLLRPTTGTRLLDIGTGSGAVGAAAFRILNEGTVVGCDLSVPMLVIARTRLAGLRTVAGDMDHLPFRAAAYDAAALGFVLSHVANPVAALSEIKRVLTEAGRVGVSSWSSSAAGSEAGEVWRDTSAQYVRASELEAAVAAAVPSENLLAAPDGLFLTLADAGFKTVVIHKREYRVEITTTEFIQSRLPSAPSRYMQAHLDPARWNDFVDAVSRRLVDAFGQKIAFRTSANFGIASGAG